MFKKTAAILVSALLLAGCEERLDQKPHLIRCGKMRIVTMAPNITEICYAIGLSNEVVGVSRFSNYPPEAKEKPIVGGLYDPNWEMIVALQSDLVIGLETQKEIAGQLKALDIRFLGVSHERIDEIMQSILTIGEACGAEAEANALFQSLETSLRRRGFQPRSREHNVSTKQTRLEASSTHIPRVLVCVGHDESLSRMYIAARGTFYDELIERAGGINACEETTIPYPEISPESLVVMNPDVVIDIFPLRQGSGQANISRSWEPYRAVVMTNDYASIPGPRFVLLLEDFIKAIHE